MWQVLLVVLVGVALIIAYVWLCGLCLVYITTPAVMWAVAIGVLAGVMIALGRVAHVLLGTYPAQIHRPDDVVRGWLSERARRERKRPDWAWPHYYVGQVLLDLKAAAYRIADDLATAIEPTWRYARDMWLYLLPFWPLALPVVAAAAAVIVGAAVGFGAGAVVIGVATGASWAMGLGVVAVLRGVDHLWRLRRRAEASCRRCFHVTRRPAYQCPGQHSSANHVRGYDLHRDLRPGALGVWWRRCGCGTRLPTTVLRAGLILEPRCPRCTSPLHEGAALATDVRIPVFGAASAGKTHLIMAGLVAWLRLPSPEGAARAPADPNSAALIEMYGDSVESNLSPAKTDPGAPPVVITVDVRQRRRRALVHVFDAAGELHIDPASNASLAYLDYARTLVFVLDPFSIPEVRDQLEGMNADVAGEATLASHDPEDSYNSTVNRLRGFGVDTGRKRLAFVLSKADLLKKLPLGHGIKPASASVREWLEARRMDNLVLQAERDFEAVEFFLVSALNPQIDGAFAPFRWLLTAELGSVTSGGEGGES